MLVARRMLAPLDLSRGVTALALALSAEQRHAVERRQGSLFLHAAAGSGKTAVLVERFVRAAREDEAPVDSILAITFTERAAAELKLRIRRRFLEQGDRTRAREAERAWVSTIHGFCSRVLRAHALAAGLDPDYRVLEEHRAAALAQRAFELALEQAVDERASPERIELLAAYTPERLREMVQTVHERLRSQGRLAPELPELPEPAPGAGPAPAGAAESYALMRELVPSYARHYAEAKQVESGLDFADLELLTRDLLRTRTAVREHYRARFRHVMVDELQDTNRLQDELIRLVAADNLFTVGDQRQSIYGFRGADVGVFAEHRRGAEEHGRAARLTVNYRSTPELLRVLNGAFSSLASFEADAAMAPGGTPTTPPVRAPAVELIVVDSGRGHWDEHTKGDAPALGVDPFGPSMRSVPSWRAAEARLLADRLADGAARGELEPDEVAVLVRAGTDLGIYERALEERGLPTYVVGGRGYWSHQQVADLRAYLAALANPYDELALLTLLASPLVGASLDTLAALRMHSRKLGRDPWWALESALLPAGDGAEGLAEALPARDRAQLERFTRRFAAERRAAPRISLERLIERAIADSGYDRVVLALPSGDRRMANLRKLMRLAREYEARDGRDLRGFVDHLDSQDLAQTREGEAPLEAETVRAVRLMTIHAAKGLEFPIVCVADLGRSGRGDDTPLRVTEDGRAGLELLSLGGERRSALDLDAIKEEQAARGEEEERRIFYVAMTRAQRRLILSGATNTQTWPQPKPLGAPMEWIWRAVAPGLEADCARSHAGESEQPASDVPAARVGYTLCDPASVEQMLPVWARAPAPVGAGAVATGEGHPPPDSAPPPAPSLPLRHVSYSALESYARCPHCFYLERVLGLGARLDPPALERSHHAAPRDGEDELAPMLRGTVVHALLERLDLNRPALISDGDVAAVIERDGQRLSAAEMVAPVRALVDGFLSSSTAARLAAATGLRRELPFAFEVSPDGREGAALLVSGVVDALGRESDRTLIVDYKTDRLDGSDPFALAERRYATQRALYALAGLRAGAALVEVVHLFLERPSEPVAAVYGQADAPALEQRVRALVAGIVAGRFEPSRDERGRNCARCAAQLSGANASEASVSLV